MATSADRISELRINIRNNSIEISFPVPINKKKQTQTISKKSVQSLLFPNKKLLFLMEKTGLELDDPRLYQLSLYFKDK